MCYAKSLHDRLLMNQTTVPLVPLSRSATPSHAIPYDARDRQGDPLIKLLGGSIRDKAKRSTRKRTWVETERILRTNFVSRGKRRDVRGMSLNDVLDVLDSILERGSPIGCRLTLTKNGKPHLVPLSGLTCARIASLPRLHESSLFPARRNDATTFSGFSNPKGKNRSAIERQ